MEKGTQRRCAVAECERRPQPGWTRCDQHVEEWLDRVLLPETRAATKAQGYEQPRYEPELPKLPKYMAGSWIEEAETRAIDELELRAMDGDR